MIELIDVQNAPEIFFDGVDDVKLLDGVVRTVIFTRHNGGAGVVVGRLAIPIAGLPDVIQALVMCLTDAVNSARPMGR